jgi:hypothetical protein
MTILTPLIDVSVGVRVWALREPYIVTDSTGRTWVVPSCFHYDKYTIPRWLQFVFPPSTGVHDGAACLHDFHCRCRKPLGLSLQECHDLFFEAMTALAMPRWKRWLKWIGVSGFGWAYSLGGGDGWYGDDRYDRFGHGTTLPDWVRQHYRADGLGWPKDAPVLMDA